MTTEVTQREVIEQIRKRVDAAEPGTWKVVMVTLREGYSYDGFHIRLKDTDAFICKCEVGYPRTKENADLIAHAPTDIKTLLQINEKQRQALEAHEFARAEKEKYGKNPVYQSLNNNAWSLTKTALSYIPEGI